MKTNTHSSLDVEPKTTTTTKRCFNRVLIALLLVGLLQPAFAGNRGQVALNGFGKTETDLTFGAVTVAKNPSTGVAGTATVQFPNTGDTYGTFSGVKVTPPTGVSTVQSNTFKTVPVPGGWGGRVTKYISGGTGASNQDLDDLFGGIPPALVVFSDIDVKIITPNPDFPDDTNSGVFELVGSASAGTAFSFKGYEIETDYPDGQGPTREELLEIGKLVFNIQLKGPFAYTEACPLRIPFRYKGEKDKMITIVDSLGKSIPFEVADFEDLIIGCNDSLAFLTANQIDVTSGGVGTISVEYSPTAAEVAAQGPGTYTVEATVSDSDKNEVVKTFTVTIGDSAPPLITRIGAASITVECGSTFTDPGATASDACDGNITSSIVKTGTVNTSSTGTYTLKYNVSDSSGNPATEVTRTVIVSDTTAPVPTVSPLPTITGGCHSTILLTPPTASDSCAGLITGKTTSATNFPTAGTYTVVWTYTDTAGNTSTQSQTVVKTSLTFIGFDPPVGGEGGTCQVPLVKINLGSKIPIKFTTFCGGVLDLVGSPTYTIEQCSGGNFSGSGIFQPVSNEWHANWDTTQVGVKAGVYKVSALLQDGSVHFIYIELIKKK